MLYLLGKVVKDSKVIGYRVLDLKLHNSVPAVGTAIKSAIVKTLDLYQILQILYAKDIDGYFRFANARLGYRIASNKTYYLTTNGTSLIWLYQDSKTGVRDVKAIQNYSTIQVANLVLEGINCDIDAYGIYGDRITPYVVLAEYLNGQGNKIGYIVADANAESTQIEDISTTKLVEKAQLKENKTGKKGLANAYLREGSIVSKNGSFYSIQINANAKPVQKPQAAQPAQKEPVQQRHKDFSVPREVVEIKAGEYCRGSITRVAIHAGVRSISPYAFLQCPALSEFVVDKSNPTLCAPGGILMSQDGATMLRCPENSGVKISTFPNYVRVIAEGAFRGCKNITSITIPNTVMRIEAGAFCGAPNLTTVICHAKEIHEDAFVDCPNLETLVLGYGVRIIRGTLVRNSPKLKYIILPDGFEDIIPSEYKAKTVTGCVDTVTQHRLIENPTTQYVMAPNTANAGNWVTKLYTDMSMYKQKKFLYCVNSADNLRKYGIQVYEKYIRKE